MFGTRKIGKNDAVFDSHAESIVAESLERLVFERIVGGYLSHVFIAGLSVDFLVKLGSQAPKGRKNRLVILEYDGLGESRRSSLLHKIHRFSELLTAGIESAWILDPSYDSVRNALLFGSPARLIRKTLRYAKSGRERIIYVNSQRQDIADEIIDYETTQREKGSRGSG